MAAKVLVVTPYSSLGNLISQSLGQNGAYQVQVADSADKALELCRQNQFSVAILDAEIPDQTIISLGQEVNTTYPQLPLVVIPPNNDIHSLLLNGLSAKAFLTKPFYLPDLIKTIDGLVSDGKSSDPSEPVEENTTTPEPVDVPQAPPWYEDPSKVLDRLTHISLGPGIHEAIITYTNEMWAYTGQLSMEAAQEISATTIHFWNSGENGDLARFVRLKTNGQQYFLYATHLSGSLVLTLIYDSNMPFSRIRYQTSQLAKSLANVDQNKPGEASQAGTIPGSAVLPVDNVEKKAETEASAGAVGQGAEAGQGETKIGVTGVVKKAVEPVPQDENHSDQPDKPGVESIQNEVKASRPAQEIKDRSIVEDYSKLPGSELEPVMRGLSNLSYHAVLVPRLPHHQLSGDLADCLAQWMPQLCQAFGWKLDKLAVLPDHLEWVVRLPPDISPVNMLEVLCQHTSQRIFTRFPYLAQENPSGDFWAPGFLLANGPAGLTADQLGDYITQIRKQQTKAEY